MSVLLQIGFLSAKQSMFKLFRIFPLLKLLYFCSNSFSGYADYESSEKITNIFTQVKPKFPANNPHLHSNICKMLIVQ
jgi:hypothetical protein